MTSLHKWIFDQSSIILSHPSTINSVDIISTIITSHEWEGKIVFFMLEDKDSLNKSVGKNLPSELFLSYEYSDTLEAIFKHDSYIFVDNIKLFREISTIKYNNNTVYDLFKSNNNKVRIIFTATLGVLPEDIAFIRSIMPGVNDAFLSLKETEIELDFIPVMTVNMNPIQIEKYNKISTINNKTELLRISNFVYPEDWDSLDNSNIEFNNWLKSNVVGNINNYSPKIHLLLHDLIGNSNDRHAIYTQFEKKNGVILLSSLLTCLDIKHTILLRSDTIDKRISNITTFNSGLGGNILITSVYPSVNILDINRIHFVEGFDISTYLGLTSRILKRSNYSILPYVRLQFYISQLTNDELSIDSEMYLKFANDMSRLHLAYNELKFHNIIAYQEGIGLKIIAVEEDEVEEDLEDLKDLKEVNENIKE